MVLESQYTTGLRPRKPSKRVQASIRTLHYALKVLLWGGHLSHLKGFPQLA